MRAAGREKRRRSQQQPVRRNKINGSSKTTTTMDSFPEEVVVEILSWLPVKSTVRFRCVCKIWLKLLTIDPHFIQLHFNHSIKTNPKPSILFRHNKYIHGSRETPTYFAFAEDYETCDKAVELDVPYKHPGHKSFQVSGICNGLLCLIDENYSNVFIWNPLTRDNTIISCSPIPSYFNQHNNYICSTRFGFGFHHATQEYKVIRVVYTRKVFQLHVSVYTLGTGTWRSLESILDGYGIFIISNRTPVLVNGALHFLAATLVSTTFFEVILSFDLKDEVFQVISSPNGVSYDDFEAVRLGELGGLLSLCYTLKDVGIDIWIMQEHGVVDSWTNQFKIKLPGLNTSLELVGGANDGRLIVRRDTRFRSKGGFILYDYKCKLIRSLQKPGFWKKPGFLHHACVFVGSLVSPQIINGVGHITDTGES